MQEKASCLGKAGSKNCYHSSQWDALIQIYNVFIHHPDATAGGRQTNRAPFIGAVDAKESISTVSEQIQRPCPQRVRRASWHNIGIVDELRVALWLALNHLGSGAPGRPFLFDRNHRRPRKL